MTEINLPYGEKEITFQIPPLFNVDQLEPDPPNPLMDPESAIDSCLSTPLGTSIFTNSNETTTVGIAINDKSRPVPQPNPIYPLLSYLERRGIHKESITLFIGSGTHTPMPASELPRILNQETIEQYRIIVHDCDQSPRVNLGKTAMKTPIRINADFFNCDVKISVGNIEPHHFMGFSGGVKTAAIGLASRETINTNHFLLAHPRSKSGLFYLNPMRQDLEDIGRKAGVHLSLGTILDEDKNIVSVYFGEPTAVMKAAIPVIRQTFGVNVSKPYDLVIASAGGAPKDINLYQAQKGLTHAARITRDDGWVVLLAACPERSGSRAYENYVKQAESNQAIIDHFKSGFFEVGPHKAFLIASEAVRVNIILVSDINPGDVKNWKLTPSKPDLIQPLIDWIISKCPEDARIATLPAATRTFPEVVNEE